LNYKFQNYLLINNISILLFNSILILLQKNILCVHIISFLVDSQQDSFRHVFESQLEVPTGNLSSEIWYLFSSRHSLLRCFLGQFPIFAQTRQIFREGVFSFAARNSCPCRYKLFDSIRFESTRFEG